MEKSEKTIADELAQLDRRTAYSKKQANDAYYDRSSPHYRDNNRFEWAIDTINRKHEEERLEIMGTT